MNMRQSSGSARVDRARRFEIALERAAEVRLAGEVRAVADPDRQRLGAERFARSSMQSMLCATACARTAASTWVRLPNLYERLARP